MRKISRNTHSHFPFWFKFFPLSLSDLVSYVCKYMLSAQSLSLHLQKKTIHWSFSIISFLHKTHHITSWLRYHKKNSFSFNLKNFNSNCVCILSSSCGKKTAPPTAIKRHNWMPIGYCQTSYQYSPIYSAFQMLMLHEWLIIGCWLVAIWHHQGGRSWQAFGERKKCLQFFRRTRICFFCFFFFT